MRLSHLNSLRALEAALRHGSFTAAADELGITPAAVGQRVRTLEQYVGEDLFDRSGLTIRPHEKALRLKSVLTNSFSTLAAALEHLKAEQLGNRISFTVPASFAENWLTPLIFEFYRRHSELDLRLDASNRDVDLLTEDFDFAIRYGRPVRAPLRETVLFGDYVLPVCSPEFAKQYDLNPRTRTFEGVPLIHLLDRTADPGWVGFEGWGEMFDFDPAHLSHGLRLTKISSGLRSAITGQGLVLCGLTEAFNEISAGRLVMPFGPELRSKTQYEYRFIWVQSKKFSSLQQDFYDWVLEKAGLFREQVAALLHSSRI